MNTKIRYTTRQDSIPVKNKISLKRFMKIVWENTRTNLHYIDFCAVNGKALEQMFYPIRFSMKCPKCQTREIHDPEGDDIPF